MVKTYYRKLRIYESKGQWLSEVEFADEVDGFYVKAFFNGKTEEEVTAKVYDFLGKNAVKV